MEMYWAAPRLSPWVTSAARGLLTLEVRLAKAPPMLTLVLELPVMEVTVGAFTC